MADSGLDLIRAAADGCISASAGLHNRLLDSKIKNPPTCSQFFYMVLTVTKGKPLLCRRLKRSFLSYATCADEVFFLIFRGNRASIRAAGGADAAEPVGGRSCARGGMPGHGD